MRRKTKAEYKNLINNAPLFAIDEARAPEEYKREKDKFIENLFFYVSRYSFIPEEQVKNPAFEYGLELLQAASDCLKSYDKTKGDFLPYFRWIYDKKVGEAELVNPRNNNRIPLNKEDRLLFRRIQRLAGEADIFDIENQKYFAETLDRPLAEVQEVIALSSYRLTREEVRDSDGEVRSIFDFIASLRGTDEELDEEELLVQIDDLFKKQQNRFDTRKVISMWLTAKILSEFDVSPSFKRALMRCSYFSKEIYELYLNGIFLEDQEIAERCGRHPSSVSRTVGQFSEEIRKMIRSKNGILD